MRKRIATWFSNAAAALADVLLELAVRLEGPRKPTQKRVSIAEVLKQAGFREIPLDELLAPTTKVAEVPAAPHPAAKEFMPLPPPEVLDFVRRVSHIEGRHSVKICRGSNKGCNGREDQHVCRDCYEVASTDRRTSDEILQAVERGNA